MRLFTVLLIILSLLIQPVLAVASVCHGMTTDVAMSIERGMMSEPVMMGENGMSLDHSHHDMSHHAHHGSGQLSQDAGKVMMECCENNASACQLHSCAALSILINSSNPQVSPLGMQTEQDVTTVHAVRLAQSLFRPPIVL